jgi:hypothetical protein
MARCIYLGMAGKILTSCLMPPKRNKPASTHNLQVRHGALYMFLCLAHLGLDQDLYA